MLFGKQKSSHPLLGLPKLSHHPKKLLTNTKSLHSTPSRPQIPARKEQPQLAAKNVVYTKGERGSPAHAFRGLLLLLIESNNTEIINYGCCCATLQIRRRLDADEDHDEVFTS